MAAMTPWTFLLVGYALSVTVECPVLLIGLSPRHSMAVKLFAGFWLTACTYPIVILAMPVLLPGSIYVLVAELFAAVAECALFAELFRGRWTWRDMAAITAANAASFLTGLALFGG
jgi:hypothetical protein